MVTENPNWGYKKIQGELQRKNLGVTEIAEVPGRGHSLAIDSGWPDVARTALDFIRRHL